MAVLTKKDNLSEEIFARFYLPAAVFLLDFDRDPVLALVMGRVPKSRVRAGSGIRCSGSGGFGYCVGYPSGI